MRNFYVLLALLLSAGATAAALAELKPAGGLTCLATQADQEENLVTTALDCEFRPYGSSAAYDVSGKMFGPGLYLSNPPGVVVVWRVLSPTSRIAPEAITGDYDITSKFNFERAQNRQDILVGGANDSVALELQSPTVDAITPATRLSLKYDRPEGVTPKS